MSIKSVRFRGRHHSTRGIFFLITGCITLVLMLVLALLAAFRSSTSEWLAWAAVAAMVLAGTGVVMDALASRERDVFITAPIVGMVINGISLVAYIIIYVIGLI